MADNPDFSSVLRVLAEKLGMTPDEFNAATIVITNGDVSVTEAPGADSVVDTESTKRSI